MSPPKATVKINAHDRSILKDLLPKAVFKRRKSKVKISKERLERHSRGEGLSDVDAFKEPVIKAKVLKKEIDYRWAEEQAARNEVLLTEQSGYLVPDEGELLKRITQKEIVQSVDITSATKHFDLKLPFGPYRFDYTRTGRHMLLGGRKGHVAALDWVTKDLLCEINVMEEVYDVQWLHIETMFAAAQKKWVYIYDNQGVELHCLKNLHNVIRMSFLPYHFLLATCSDHGWLSWLDISIGELVAKTNTKLGRLTVMEQNPFNALLCVGESKGVVSMWSPNVKKPLVSMLCHRTSVQALAIDHTGKYLATSSAEKQMRIWDLRQLTGPLHDYRLRGSPSDLSFSQSGCLAVSVNNMVEVYKECHLKDVKDPYLMHRTGRSVEQAEFCPYEDVLGVTTWSGFTSLLVPGSGEANFDGLEVNPLRSKTQRRETEVKSLLEKIQPEMICLDPSVIMQVDVPTLKERMETKAKLLYMKPPKLDFTPRLKSKRGKTVRAAKTKKVVLERSKKEFIKDMKEAKEELLSDIHPEKSQEEAPVKKSVLDRFKPKKK